MSQHLVIMEVFDESSSAGSGPRDTRVDDVTGEPPPGGGPAIVPD